MRLMFPAGAAFPSSCGAFQSGNVAWAGEFSLSGLELRSDIGNQRNGLTVREDKQDVREKRRHLAAVAQALNYYRFPKLNFGNTFL